LDDELFPGELINWEQHHETRGTGLVSDDAINEKVRQG
jgi:hypothetical protein